MMADKKGVLQMQLIVQPLVSLVVAIPRQMHLAEFTPCYTG